MKTKFQKMTAASLSVPAILCGLVGHPALANNGFVDETDACYSKVIHATQDYYSNRRDRRFGKIDKKGILTAQTDDGLVYYVGYSYGPDKDDCGGTMSVFVEKQDDGRCTLKAVQLTYPGDNGLGEPGIDCG